MVLHYMAGKSDESVNSILFVWAEPVDWQTLQPGLIVIPPLPPDHELNPRATFYNLCAKAHDRTNMIGSLEENSRSEIITRPTGVKPSLHALVIGINKYQSYNHLVAAVPDALNFKLYLTQDLLVPEEQIKLLLDEQATKWNIILALRGLSCEDNGIKLNDPIVIYYAGYGGEVDPPPDQVLNRPAVQCIVPQDTNKTSGTYPIPDFTIGALVHDIAREKGNNITLIFDCCYYLSGVRDEIPPGILSRVIDKKDLPPFTTYSDRTPIHGTLYGSHIADLYTQGLGSPGTETHVLLTACGYQESAFESSNRPGEYGYFSKTLLETLRSVGVNSLTYEGLIRRLSTLKTNMVQNPGCKGKNVNRILFDGQVTGARTTFIAIEVKEDAFYLQAGLVHGITPGFKYAIHSGDIFGPSDTIIGTFEVDQVDPFTARLKSGNALDLLSLYYGRQVGYGSDQAMSIYVTEDFVKAAEPSKTWSHILRGGKDSILIRPTSPGLARVILSAYGKKETMFKLTNQASVKYGIETLPPPGGPSIPPSASQVVPILSALSKWHWYLYHAPASRPLQDFLDVEFYKLHPAGGYTDGVSILEPEGENLIVGGEVNIVANPEDRYGIRLVNRSSADLYVYLLSFSPTSLAIVHKSIPPIGSRGALLPKSKALTIGYGPGGQLPFTFSIDKALRMDATILRLFVSTHQTDIEGIEQDSPFGANGASASQGLKELFGRDAVWDVIGVNVACRRQSKKDEGIIEPFGGITLISNLEPTTEPKPEPTIIPNLDLGIIPPIGADTLAPSVLFPGSASADTSLIPSSDGVLFTGRSSTRRMVEALTSDATFLPWFRTPALTPELLLSTRCMRLRTLGSAKGPGGANSSAERDGYFEISVIGPDGLTKLSANKTEMTYYSHSASKSIEWLDGIVFGEDHELWKNLGVGDYFEVSICATGREWVCEAKMGNLIFW
ncbi:caspase domain-containing protein [Rhizoctonia solani]|nr:caspase domain-containing protein [Rhizoctonia solani]